MTRRTETPPHETQGIDGPGERGASAPARPDPDTAHRPRTSLLAHGEPWIWLTGGALGLSILMIAGLLGLILARGGATFWPLPVTRIDVVDGSARMGEVTREENYHVTSAPLEALPSEAAPRPHDASDGTARRRQLRTGNFDLTGTHFHWVSDLEVAAESRPEWAVVLERRTYGRFYGVPKRFAIDGETVADGPEAAWSRFVELHGAVVDRFEERQTIQEHDFGQLHALLEDARLGVREAELHDGPDSEARRQAAAELERMRTDTQERTAELAQRVEALDRENARYALSLETADGREVEIALADIVRAYPANRLSFGEKASIYLSRWREFLFDDPREANSEGGVWPAIVGTVVMTLLMTLAVVPFGVLAALYLREYARPGPLVSVVRIAVNNLAGVPSIVFGVFGLGFFCYIVGGTIDQVLFEAKLPNPTFGKGGILWASATLALLTLPVVIVATEEALAAVPGSLREGSYGCGASKWQTIRRVVLPRALPGIMTGFILAMARGAGEVAPLMLVGVVKLAPTLPVDGAAPFLHPERSFMHLGFHVYDVGFQSQNSEAAKPMVFTTTLLLIAIITALNLMAIWIRSRLRRRFTVTNY